MADDGHDASGPDPDHAAHVDHGREDGVGGDEAERQPWFATDEPCNSRLLDLAFRPPPRDEEVLVEGEVVLYKRRQHGASLVKDAARTASLVWLALQVVLGVFGGLSIPESLLTLMSIGMLVHWGANRSRWRVATTVLSVVVLAVLIQVFVQLDQHSLALALVAFAVLHMGESFVQWRCYRFLYVTDRRVIQTTGIFNRDYATMPISKITDVRLRVTFFADKLDYGEFFIESAGQAQALGRLKYLRDPDFFSSTVLRIATDPVSLDDIGY